MYEFLLGLAYLKKDVWGYKIQVESYLEVLGLENDAITEASMIYADLKSRGALVEDPDLLIAGICIAKGLPLVTGNSKHFDRFRAYGLKTKQLSEFVEALKTE